MSQCACSPANRPELPIEGYETTKTIRATGLCTQCAAIDLNAIIQDDKYDKYRHPWLRSTRVSACPFCRFFAEAATRHNNPLPDPNSEVLWRLEVHGPSSAFSDLLANSLILVAIMKGYKFVGVRNKAGNRKPVVIWPGLNTPISDPAPVFSLRHIQPASIDFELLSGWITYCKAHHAETCEVFPGYPRNLRNLKVINCKTRIVIEAPVGCEFAALSYVWGAKELNRASDDGLLPKEAPMTITDAIQATLRLGIQYLWVDQYCIDQSNEGELQQQISIMDMIYNLATVTLVAACGEDASYGLPGVGSKARIEQTSLILDGRLWISCTTCLADGIKNSQWFSRAWTYQEGLFSRRRLIFTDEQVYFECNNTRCQEMVAYDLHHLANKMEVQTGGLFQGALSFEYRQGLEEHIEEYTRRSLTYQGDALNAMRGVFRAFASMPSPVRTLWGIPIDRYEGSNSCWPANKKVLNAREERFEGYFDSAFARALCWCLDKPALRREGFPSWSWAGWMGPLRRPYGWGFIKYHFGDSELTIWLQKKDGTYDRLSEAVIDRFDQTSPLAMDYTSILRIEAWVIDVSFVHVAGGFEDIETHWQYNNPRPTYFMSAKVDDDDPPSERCQTCYWPLILSAQVTADDQFHRELCEAKFYCIVLSIQDQFGLVVRKCGDFAERIGHMELYWSHAEPDDPHEPLREKKSNGRYYNMFKYLPRSKEIVLLR